MRTDDLLQAMESMFDQPLGKLDLQCKFEARMWKRDKSFSDYCHDKLILGNRVSIATEELVEYMIDGIPIASLQNQARMQSFSPVQELMVTFKKIKLRPEIEYQRPLTLIGNDTQRKMSDKTGEGKELTGAKVGITSRGVIKLQV